MKIALALTSALLLAGAALAAPHEAPYRAHGAEPGWTLTIDGGLIHYVGDYGRTKVTTRAPEARPSFNGRRYVTRRITVDVTRARCDDGASDRVYPERVTIMVGGKTAKGCGGAPLAASRLVGTRWTIASVDDYRPKTQRPTDIRFTANRIEGNAGCNSSAGHTGSKATDSSPTA